jgi:hypothetical protein
MTPKEKANQLFNRYQNEVGMFRFDAIKCALIAVDEILHSHYESLEGIKQSTYDHFLEVKREIAKL